jgi:MFS transporter, DHA2 family, methylenomycin A resistance protein
MGTQTRSPGRTRPRADRGSKARGSPRAVLVVMCLGYFLVLLDVTIVNVGLPRIGSALHAGVSSLQWVVDGYALVLAALMLGGGTFGDLRGHRRMVLSGLVIFGAGSLACGLAPSSAALVAARAVQGIGAALLLPGTLAIITHAFPKPAEQARAIGVWAGVGSLALPAGPLLGGLLIAGFGWRALFLLNVPIVLVAFIAALRIAPESVESRSRRLDAQGVALGTLFLVALTFAVIQAGRTGPSPAVLGAALTAAGSAVLFVLCERRRGSEAMLPLGLFRNPVFTTANGLAGAMNLGTLGTLFVLSLYLQSIQHRSVLTAGLALIPLFAPLAVIAPLAGRLTSRIGPRLPIAVGLVIAAAGLGLLGGAGTSAPYPYLLGAFLLWGSGLGLLTPAVVTAAVGSVTQDRAGLASAINNTARQAGGAIGVAIAGAVAGTPADGGGFVSGFHAVAVGSAVVYVIAAGLGGVLIPGRRPQRPG